MARHYYSSGPYRMTAARKAALKKAQIASAKKRRRKRIALGVGGVAAAGVAAWGGHKYGSKAGSIAADMRARTPTNVKNASARVRAAVQPMATHATRMRNGLTKGYHHGAGPDAGQSKPAPPWAHAPSSPNSSGGRKYKRIKLDDTTREQAQALQDAAEGVVREKWIRGNKIFTKTRKLGPGDRQQYNEDGTIKQRMRGIPSAVLHGRKLSGRKYSSILDHHNRKKAEAGADAHDMQGRRDMFNAAKRSGQVYGRYQSEKQRDASRVRNIRRRNSRAKRRAAQEIKFRNQVMDQWLKDNPDA